MRIKIDRITVGYRRLGPLGIFGSKPRFQHELLIFDDAGHKLVHASMTELINRGLMEGHGPRWEMEFVGINNRICMAPK